MVAQLVPFSCPAVAIFPQYVPHLHSSPLSSTFSSGRTRLTDPEDSSDFSFSGVFGLSLITLPFLLF